MENWLVIFGLVLGINILIFLYCKKYISFSRYSAQNQYFSSTPHIWHVQMGCLETIREKLHGSNLSTDLNCRKRKALELIVDRCAVVKNDSTDTPLGIHHTQKSSCPSDPLGYRVFYL